MLLPIHLYVYRCKFFWEPLLVLLWYVVLGCVCRFARVSSVALRPCVLLTCRCCSPTWEKSFSRECPCTSSPFSFPSFSFSLTVHTKFHFLFPFDCHFFSLAPHTKKKSILEIFFLIFEAEHVVKTERKNKFLVEGQVKENSIS